MARKPAKKAKAKAKAASSKGGRPPEAQDALDAYGLDKVCESIADGVTLTNIAKGAKVSLGALLAWIDAVAERSARVREARTSTAKLWDEKGEDELRKAGNPFQLAKARELAQHYRWRASKIAAKEYGDRQTLTHEGKVGLESIVAGAEPAE